MYDTEESILEDYGFFDAVDTRLSFLPTTENSSLGTRLLKYLMEILERPKLLDFQH